MKVILGSFFLGFVLLFTIAAVKGVVSKIGPKSAHVFRNIDSSKINLLIFKCDSDSDTIFEWNIDKNRLTAISPEGDLFYAFSPRFDPFSLEKTSDVILAFMGGASASYEMNDLKNMIRSRGAWIRKGKRVFGSLAGAISGYTLGDWIGAYWLSSCKSQKVLTYISDEGNWPEIEKAIGSLHLTMALKPCCNRSEKFSKYRKNNNSSINHYKSTLRELESVTREEFYAGRKPKEGMRIWERFLFESEYHRQIFNLEFSLHHAQEKEKIMETTPKDFIDNLVNDKNYDFESSDFEYIELLYYVCK